MPRTCKLSLALFLALALLPLWGGAALAGAKADIIAGNAAAQAGKLKQAIRLYTRALKSGKLSRTNQAVAYSNRGSAWDDLGRADRAIQDFNQAIQADPSYAPAYYNRSFAYEKKGLLKLALEDMKKALDLEPDDLDYRQRVRYLEYRLSKTR